MVMPPRDRLPSTLTELYSLSKRHMGTDYRKKIDGKYYTPQEISAFILMKLKEDAEDFLGQPVTDAVVTVPPILLTHKDKLLKMPVRLPGLTY